MSKEYANQKVREGKCELSAAVRFDAGKVAKLLKEHGDFKYFPADDLPSLINESIKQLRETGKSQGEHYTFGFDSKGVNNLLCSLLRVPSPEPEPEGDPRLKGQTEVEVKGYADSHKEAIRMAKKVSPESGTTVPLEEFHRLLDQTKNPTQVEKILLSAKAKDVPLILPGGQQLPAVPPVPKTLTADKAFAVRLLISCVDENENVATATLRFVDEPNHPAFKNILQTSVRVAYSSTNLRLRKQLLAMQLFQKEFQCNVSVTRALRSRDAKHNRLRIINPLKFKEDTSALVAGLQQLQLEFGDSSIEDDV